MSANRRPLDEHRERTSADRRPQDDHRLRDRERTSAHRRLQVPRETGRLLVRHHRAADLLPAAAGVLQAALGGQVALDVLRVAAFRAHLEVGVGVEHDSIFRFALQ